MPTAGLWISLFALVFAARDGRVPIGKRRNRNWNFRAVIIGF